MNAHEFGVIDAASLTTITGGAFIPNRPPGLGINKSLAGGVWLASMFASNGTILEPLARPR